MPWTDLRYLFGEIMYGGHITDDWDRRLCRTYLEEFMKPEQVCYIPLDIDVHVHEVTAQYTKCCIHCVFPAGL